MRQKQVSKGQTSSLFEDVVCSLDGKVLIKTSKGEKDTLVAAAAFHYPLKTAYSFVSWPLIFGYVLEHVC